MSVDGSWEFHNPVKLVARAGAAFDLARHFQGDGRLLVVCTPGLRRRGGLARILAGLRGRKVEVLVDVAPNPDLGALEGRLAGLAGSPTAEILAIGGGSVLDTAKVIAVGLWTEGFSLRGHLLGGEPLPTSRRGHLVCVPTTAGTGSEVTPFATVWDWPSRKKHSLSGAIAYPDVAVLDASLTLSLPQDITVSAGLDAITHAFEATWSRRANPVSDALAVRAISLGLEVLPRLQHHLDDLSLRSAMLEASTLAGLAISRAHTALCHSMSYPITAAWGVPHGLACAFTLPEVLAFNREADPARFERLALALGFSAAGPLHSRVVELMDELDVATRLRPFVGDGTRLADLAPAMLTPGRSDNNLRDADEAAVARLIAEASRNRGL